ncbi:MAG: hypothetical protein ACRED1_04195 [Limisphaerales bacterium]
MKAKLVILTAAFFASGYLFAGSAPPATPERAAPQARTGPVAPTPVAPAARPAPIAPIAPVARSPLAPIAPGSVPRNVNSNWAIFPYPYAYAHGSNGVYFTNGIPTAYLRNTNSVYWATNPPYGNPVVGYTNNMIRPIFLHRRRQVPATNANQTASPIH